MASTGMLTHAACAVCGLPTSTDYRCKGSNCAIHWWESMDRDASKEEGRHRAHYWYPGCWRSGLSVMVRDGVAVAMSPTKSTTASNFPSKSANCNSSPYRTQAKSTSKKSTSSKFDSVQKAGTPTGTKPKRSMSRNLLQRAAAPTGTNPKHPMSCNLVQRAATPTATNPKHSMSCGKHSVSPGNNQNLKSSGPKNLLPPSKKQRRATSQGKNSIPSKAKPITALPSASNPNNKPTHLEDSYKRK